ncbi:hypothetical protein GMO_04470 [Gluconobacter morbifer G707]|uniref:Uncharacterized protein n=1 Tax=Gluconobacter morbifer G707 TaxID=1088869 RepID=G6XG32_9PROT|nr:hypothetical protein GMO_04470 [Gluconobacter morbifer G707]
MPRPISVLLNGDFVSRLRTKTTLIRAILKFYVFCFEDL